MFPTGFEFRITGAIAEGDRVALEAASPTATTPGSAGCSNNRYHPFVQLEDWRHQDRPRVPDTGQMDDVLGTLRIAP